MFRKILLALLVLLVPSFAFAQTATVTGTAADANGNAYFPGTVSAYVQVAVGQPLPAGVPASGSIGPNATTAGGNFSVLIPTTVSSSWVFTICGVPKSIGPLGNNTPTQVCFSTGPILISGSTSITGSLPAIPILGPGGGGGITSVSSLPGTCTPGVTANVNLTIAGFGYGEFYCSGLPGSNTWTPVNPQQTISPIAYGAHKKYFVTHCTFTASAVVNCTGGDVHFLAQATQGDIAFGTSGLTSVSSAAAGVLACPDTTILTINSDTQVTLNAACTVPCTPAAGVTCNFAWGTGDDTTALENAKAAAWNNADSCYALQPPSWPIFVNSQYLNGPVGDKCGGGTGGNATYFDLNSQGPAVFGQGGQASKIIPRPTFDYSSCNKGISGKGCALTATNINAQNFGIDGLQQSLPTTTHAVNLVELNGLTGFCSGGVTFNNIGLAGWATQSTSSVGLDFGRGMCNDSVLYNINMQQFGASTVSFAGSGAASNTVSTIGLMAYGATGNNVILNGNAGTIWNSSNSNYFTNFTSNNGIVSCGGANMVFNSTGDSFAPTTNTGVIQHIFFCNGGAMTINLDKAYVATVGGTATSNLFFLNGTSTIHIRNSRLDFSSGTTRLATMGAGDKIYDDGGNTWTPGTTQSVITNWYAPGHSLQGACTGVGTASSTLGLYGTGANVVATTCTSVPTGTGSVMTSSGTLEFLNVSATAAGTNASSGVVTVLKNGAGTTITCTIGTATSCSDFVHTVAFVAGDLISIQFTTQLADTLAGVKALVEWN